MKKALQKQYLRKLGNKILLISLLVIGFTNCGRQTNDPCGLTLQEFEVIDPQLKVLIEGIRETDKYKENEEHQESILVIELIKNDSTLEFGFVFADKSSLSEMYIFKENKRIIGYLNIEQDIFIILSNVISRHEFYDIFYEFIIPTGNKQQFEYVYFPDDLYHSVELDKKDMIYKWPPPLLFDPYYHWYTYKDGKYVYQEDFHDQRR